MRMDSFIPALVKIAAHEMAGPGFKRREITPQEAERNTVFQRPSAGFHTGLQPEQLWVIIQDNVFPVIAVCSQTKVHGAGGIKLPIKIPGRMYGIGHKKEFHAAIGTNLRAKTPFRRPNIIFGSFHEHIKRRIVRGYSGSGWRTVVIHSVGIAPGKNIDRSYGNIAFILKNSVGPDYVIAPYALFTLFHIRIPADSYSLSKIFLSSAYKKVIN
jgi:hypothetical protein